MPKIRISSLTGTTGQSPAHFRLFNSAGITAVISLAALPAIFSLAPMFGVAEANAEPSTGPSTIGAAATISPILSLSARNVSMVMTPIGSGTVFKTASIDATVSTNNETGYTLYFSDKDDNTSLKHANLADQAINSVETPATGTSMLPNTWGYTLDAPAPEGESEINNATNLGLTYKSIPTDYTTIKTRDTQTTPNETSKLTFGVKIDSSIPSGTYSDEILISAVINYSSAGYDQNQLWLDKNGVQITTMQEMTPDVCASVPTPNVTATGTNIPTITLTDTRDSKTYTVKKLADGNCWMTSDLALGSTTEDMTLTPDNSNVATDFTLHAAKTAANQTANSYSADYTFTGNSENENAYLYNFYAATAGSGTQALAYGNASQDICPKGWHLPNSDNNASWNKLLRVGQGGYQVATDGHDYSDSVVSWGTKAKFTVAEDNPLGMHFTGYFNNGSLSNTDNGHYWSRTAQSGNGAYYLYFSNSVSPQNYSYKSNGFAVRCVATGTTPTASTYMQEVTDCPASLPEGTQYTLKDQRDNKEYTVAKLPDGNCWMTKNLAIGGGTTLTPETSNVTSEHTLPVSSIKGFSDKKPEDSNVEGLYESSNEDYGVYYSWRTVTAGIGTTSITTGNINQDICPKGWRLPVKAEFDKLINDTGWSNSEDWVKAPFYGQLAGGAYNGGVYSATGSGRYWSSSANNTNVAHVLTFNETSVDTSYSVKAYGFSVRCLLK